MENKTVVLCPQKPLNLVLGIVEGFGVKHDYTFSKLNYSISLFKMKRQTIPDDALRISMHKNNPAITA